MGKVFIDPDTTQYTLIVAEDLTQRATLSISNEDAVLLLRELTQRFGAVEFVAGPKQKRRGFLGRIKEVFSAGHEGD